MGTRINSIDYTIKMKGDGGGMNSWKGGFNFIGGNFGGDYIKIKIKDFQKSENREKCR